MSMDGGSFHDTAEFSEFVDDDFEIGSADVFYDAVEYDASVLEYPQKAWLDPIGFAADLDGASATCNLMQPEAHDVLLVEMMTQQNECPVRSPRPVPHYPDTEFRPFDEELQQMTADQIPTFDGQQCHTRHPSSPYTHRSMCSTTEI